MVTDFLRFRGSYGTSFRAPALFEQFLADETSFPSQGEIDPCIQWANNLALGIITQTIADNCAADGVPPNHPGGGVTATARPQAVLACSRPELSTAWVVGAILTPRFGFLADTRISIAVDYFQIKVEGEISQLGARNIIFGCYGSANFPNDPLCDLFTRGQTAAPFNIATVSDQFVNIASQHNTGVDVTANIRHDLGKLGTVSLIADMAWQIKDDVPASTHLSDRLH